MKKDFISFTMIYPIRLPDMRIILFALLFFISSCTKNNENQFHFASSGEFPPFSSVNAEGQLTGYDIAVGTELAKRLGLEPVAHRYKFAGIVEGVKAGRFDAAVASHTITSERAQHVAFTQPYYFSGPQVFLRENEKLESREEIKGKDIAVSKGSTYVAIAQEYSNNIQIYDSDITALEALQNGRHDLVITDSIAGLMALNRGLKISSHLFLGTSEQAIAVSLENSDLLEKLDRHLSEMKNDGTLKSLSIKYLGQDLTQSINAKY
jgi:polar amino acid transport system substrate-binding protein